jgi:hypothetical protein
LLSPSDRPGEERWPNLTPDARELIPKARSEHPKSLVEGGCLALLWQISGWPEILGIPETRIA